MSSVLRVFKFRSYFNTAARSLFNNTHNVVRNSELHHFKLPLQLGPVKIYERAFAVQHAQSNDDLASHMTTARTLELDFQLVDSILERGSYLKKKTLEKLINKVSFAQEITPSQAIFLLNCCGRSSILESKVNRRKLVTQVWKIFQDKGLNLDISHYNAFLQVLVENEAEFSPLDFLATLEEKNIKPNRLTFSRLIAKFCQKGDIEGANKILEHMKNNGLEINEYIFSSLILGNSRANDLEAAAAVVDIMKQSNINLGPDTYAALIQANAEHKKYDEIDRILSDAKKESLTDNTMLEIISILAEQSPISVIEKILGSLENKEALPTVLFKQATSNLIFSGYDELAYKLYKSQHRDNDRNYIGSFFPKLIASANLSLNKVANYCDEIRKNGLNILSYELALESYLQDRNFESIMSLARVMKERGIPLKEHYFYPVLIEAAKEDNIEKVFAVFDEIVRFQIPLSLEFYSDFLLPCLKVTNENDHIDSIYTRFYSYRDELNFQNVYNGFVEYLLRTFNIVTTAQFVSRHPRGISVALIPSISSSYVNTLNEEAAAKILSQLLPLDIRMRRDFVVEEVENRCTGLKSLLNQITYKLKYKDLFDYHMPLLLKAMKNEGVYLVPSIIELLTSKFGESINADIQETLQKLGDPSLITESSSSSSSSSSYGIDIKVMRPSLRHRIAESEASGQIDKELNIQLLLLNINKGKTQDAEEVIQKLKANKIALSPNIKLMVLSMYIDNNQFENAEAELNDFLETYPDVQISPQKIIKIAKMFINLGRFEDALKCILINSPKNGNWPVDQSPDIRNNYYRNSILYILSTLAKNSDLSTLQRTQEALLSNNFAPPGPVMASLISYYIHQDNIEEAFTYFKKIAEEHKVTAGKMELMKTCVVREDAERLQQILDISNEIHGDLNTLYDLVFCFVELGKLAQAEKVLQTTGMRTPQGKLYEHCRFLARTGRPEEIKGLISISKHVFSFNRRDLYGYLLEAYILADDPDNSLDVWTLMQEEGISPDDEFLSTLGNYLKSKGRDVPFSIPQTASEIESSVEQDLLQAIRNKNSTKVKQLVENLRRHGVNIPAHIMSQVLSIYINYGKISEATELVKGMIVKGVYPDKVVFERVLRAIEDDADVKTMKWFGNHMDKDIKRSYYYNSRLSTTLVNSGQAKELLESEMKLIQERSDIMTDDILLGQISLGKIVKKHPEMHSEVVNLIEVMTKHENQNIQMLAKTFNAVLYEHYFLSEKFEEAEKFYEYFKDANDFGVRNIVNYCLKENDTDKLEKLIEIVNRKAEGREKMKGYIYSVYVNILNNQEKVEEAVNVIKKSFNDGITLENYAPRSLLMLKTRMELQNLTFPFEIPSKKQEKDSSSSSSSSDDEK